jgi:hypothetical protein
MHLLPMCVRSNYCSSDGRVMSSLIKLLLDIDNGCFLSDGHYPMDTSSYAVYNLLVMECLTIFKGKA